MGRRITISTSKIRGYCNKKKMMREWNSGFIKWVKPTFKW
jgi:hypothetical protein